MTRFCVLFSKKNLSSPHKNLKVETTLQKEFKVHCLSIISRSTSLRLDVAFTHSLTPYSRNIRSTNIMIFNGKKFLTSTRSRLTLFPITFTSFTVLFAFWLSSKEFSSVHIAFHWWWCCCYCWCLLLCFVDFFFIVFNGISIDEVYVYSEAEYMAPLERRNIFFRFLFQFSVVHFSRFSQQSSHYLISTISFDSFLAYFLILCYFSGDAATAHQIDDFTMSRTIPIGNVWSFSTQKKWKSENFSTILMLDSRLVHAIEVVHVSLTFCYRFKLFNLIALWNIWLRVRIIYTMKAAINN